MEIVWLVLINITLIFSCIHEIDRDKTFEILKNQIEYQLVQLEKKQKEIEAYKQYLILEDEYEWDEIAELNRKR